MEETGQGGKKSRVNETPQRLIGGQVDCVWLGSILDEPEFQHVGIALCLLDKKAAKWVPQDDPVPFHGAAAAGIFSQTSGGIDYRRGWAFKDEQAPRSPGEYRIEIFARNAAGNLHSVWHSAETIQVHPLPRLRIVGGLSNLEDGAQDVALDEGLPATRRATVCAPVSVEQPIPPSAFQNCSVRTAVALYRVLGVAGDEPVSQVLRQSVNGDVSRVRGFVGAWS